MTSASATAQPKRFYKTASATKAEGGWTVQLDTRLLKTPAKAPLTLPTQALAETIAAEWEAQGERIHIQAMHLTRLANVAIDRTPETRAGMADEVANYCGTDLLCHTAEAPADLVERQSNSWAPIREWAGEALGVVLLPVPGIIAAPQPEASLTAARTHAASLDDFRLTGLAYAMGLLGSALLALAIEQGRLTAREAYALSRVDEEFQIEQWGEDEDALDRVRKQLVEVDTVHDWFAGLTT